MVVAERGSWIETPHEGAGVGSVGLMAEPSWQELLRLRLIERDAAESSFSSVIEQCLSSPLFRPPILMFSRSPSRPTDKVAQGTQCHPPQSSRLRKVRPRLLRSLRASFVGGVRLSSHHPHSPIHPLPEILSGLPTSPLWNRRYPPCAMNLRPSTKPKAKMHNAYWQ